MLIAVERKLSPVAVCLTAVLKKALTEDTIDV